MSFRSVLILAALAVPASVALADSPLSDPDSLPKVGCTAIHYSNAFLKKHPLAPAAPGDAPLTARPHGSSIQGLP
jgi:hypothetical protein